jgi:hypothetical protein
MIVADSPPHVKRRLSERITKRRRDPIIAATRHSFAVST